MRRFLFLGVAITMSAATVAGTTTGASASPSRARIGAAPRIPAGATPATAPSAETLLQIDVTLQPRDPGALATYAQEVSTPGSPLFRHYISPSRFADEFGPTSTAIRSVEAALTAAGLHPGAMDANHLFIPVEATVAQLSSALSTSFAQYKLPSGRTAYANRSAPSLPAGVASYVQGVVGLDDLHLPTPQVLRPSVPKAAPAAPATPAVPAARAPQIVTGGPQPCQTAAEDASAEGEYTADELASAYGFSSLYGAGDRGSGATVAVMEFEPDLTSDIAEYQSCYGTDTPVSYVKVDKGPGNGAGSGEAALDIEDVIGFAPEVAIVDYEAPNTGTAWFDDWDEAVSQDAAQVITDSWGLCEPEDSGFSTENTLFEEAAVQGQSILAAAGDSGSEDCGDNSLAVDDPASQPYVTGVGGTTLTALGPPPTETVWNDGFSGGGGGGGISSVWTMPSYQSGAKTSVGVINAYSSGAPCGAASGQYCREVPDVSIDADENTGYEIYWDGSWGGVGGTSAAAPAWAALLALTNASSSCDGEAIGFANPDLYSVAGSDPSAFHDITSGNNDVTGTNGGLYPALVGYDMASGLGTPNGASLPAALCSVRVADPVSMTNPGGQSTLGGREVGLQITASDSTPGQTLTYSASGLPTGLSIGATGLISGTPTATGVFTTVVTAEDANGASAAARFTWWVATITSLNPAYGPSAGGTKIKVSGTGFTGATGLTIASASVSRFTVNKAGTVVTGYTPPGSGTSSVQILGPTGNPPITLATDFDYGPTVTGVRPNGGTTAGGTKVTITGTNFTGASSVMFGSVPVSSGKFTVKSSKTITAYSPSQGAGPVDITVTTPGGTSQRSSSDIFTYSTSG